MSLFTKKVDAVDSKKVHPEFEILINEAKISLDNFMGSLRAEELEKVDGLIQELNVILRGMEAISREMVSILQGLTDYMTDGRVRTDDEILKLGKRFSDRIDEQMRAARKLQENGYAELLRNRRKCFDAIYREIDEDADAILKSM